jgi:ATP-dependent Clp protease protease subunit
MNKITEDFKKFARDKGVTTTMSEDYEKYIDNSLTPYILEEREMRVTQMDIFSRLLMDRNIWIYGTVNDQMASIVNAQLMFLDDVNQKDIKLQISSPGGSVLSGLSMVDMINVVKSDIQTMNMGLCASMGSILVACGTPGKRLSLPFSKIMIHQVSSGASGTVMDNRISHMESEKYNYILFKLLSQYTGKDFGKVLDVANRDKWFTSDEAKDFGLIDEVIDNGQPSVSKYLEGFDEHYKNIILKTTSI